MPNPCARNRIYLSDSIDLCVERGVQIRLRCSNAMLAERCGHVLVLPAGDLAALCSRHGWPRYLIGIGEHLRCTLCGSRWPHIEVVGQ